MTDLVDHTRIEQIVGAMRHRRQHVGRAVSAQGQVYILHSMDCQDSGIDLRHCEFSKALDEHGIDVVQWAGFEDRPVFLAILTTGLAPVVITSAFT